MNFENFSNQYFQGNVEAALEHLAKESYYRNYSITKTGDNLQVILDSMNSDLASRFMYYIKQESKKNPEVIKNVLNEVKNFASLDLSYDEVKNATINPYKAKLVKTFFKFLIGGSGLVAFSLIGASLGQIGLVGSLGAGVATLFNSYIAYDMGINLVNYIKFKKAKKFVSENEKIQNNLDEEVKKL